MDIKTLKSFHKQKLINLAGVCKASKLSYSSILNKCKENHELKVNEARAINKALEPIARAVTGGRQ